MSISHKQATFDGLRDKMVEKKPAVCPRIGEKHKLTLKETINRINFSPEQSPTAHYQVPVVYPVEESGQLPQHGCVDEIVSG